MVDPDIYGDSYEIAAALRKIAKSIESSDSYWLTEAAVESSDTYWLMEAAASIEGLYDALVEASKEISGHKSRLQMERYNRTPDKTTVIDWRK